MSLGWRARPKSLARSLAWSNPVAWWWGLLTLVSVRQHRRLVRAVPRSSTTAGRRQASASGIELMLLLCAAYVFGCAFRSLLPRADVQRICLFDTWLSSVMVGRSVATVAELCFAAQWAIVLQQLGTHDGRGHHAERRLGDRAADRDRGMLLLVRGADHQLSSATPSRIRSGPWPSS